MAVEKRIGAEVFYAHGFEREALRPRLLLVSQENKQGT
jgi:hypothetical protein